LRGWANYHKHVVAKKTFARVDADIWSMLWRWATRRHPQKGTQWIKEKYFQTCLSGLLPMPQHPGHFRFRSGATPHFCEEKWLEAPQVGAISTSSCGDGSAWQQTG
jgi:hypothetical protein